MNMRRKYISWRIVQNKDSCQSAAEELGREVRVHRSIT